MEKVFDFLEMNGFENIVGNIFFNGKCYVEIEEKYYKVSDKEDNAMYSNDHNIYWLIGVLTYYDYIGKNYFQ